MTEAYFQEKINLDFPMPEVSLSHNISSTKTEE